MTYPFLFDEQHQSSGAVIRGRSRKNVIGIRSVFLGGE